MKNLILSLCLLAAALPACAADEKLDAAAHSLAAAISQKPAGLTGLLDADFFRQVSLEKAGSILADTWKAYGGVVAVRAVRSESPLMGHYVFETDKGYDLPAAVALSPESGRVSGFFFGQAARHNPTLKSVADRLGALPGAKAFLVRRLGGDGASLEDYHGSDTLAVGSAFKLYVLGAVIKERRPWKKIINLDDGDRSLPTGRLQDWPAGAPFTAYTLAGLMIADSDNTAADMLISALGRRNIEDDLKAMGHSDPARLKPFLRTSELFRLKSDSEATLKYINLPLDERYVFLSSLSSRPLSAAAVKQSPFGVARVEWPASPADLCRVMDYIRRNGGGEAMDILAINPGLTVPEGFRYAGYKGGAEPGVLSMTWLLQDKKDNWYCVSGAWNDEVNDLDQQAFFELMQTALNALAPAR